MHVTTYGDADRYGKGESALDEPWRAPATTVVAVRPARKHKFQVLEARE